MQRLQCNYAAYFNERHSLVGHVFQQRFDSRLIETEAHFLEALKYIAFNPVRAGLCNVLQSGRGAAFTVQAT